MSSDRLVPHVLCIVGARPNFMKIAPIMRALNQPGAPLSASLLHTGQHYDEAMKASFFDQLGIPEPDVDLGVGSGSHAWQTAQIMQLFELDLDVRRPDAILVVGDVNSTIACALVAVKKGIPVIHVEAGLRSYDRQMPEEINRVLTDQISELLFTTERGAEANLLQEGITAERIHFVGNVMIDTLFANRAKAIPPEVTLGAVAGGNRILNSSDGFGLVTLHRPSNVDRPEILRDLLETLADIAERLPLVFPIHPRTQARIEAAGLAALLAESAILRLGPMGYLELLGVMANSRLVLTDSGGIQEETTALGIPCITLRDNTERPITVSEGTNTVVGAHPQRIRDCVLEIVNTGGKVGRVPELWDGKAAERIARVIAEWFQSRAGGASAVRVDATRRLG